MPKVLDRLIGCATEAVEREGGDVLATDLQDAWDILMSLLRGAGFKGARNLGECLSNGYRQAAARGLAVAYYAA